MAGRDIGETCPTASEYFRYVSIDATTTRASTVTRSMPTSDTRTHASITMPLSSTRSSTSISELPLGVRSTAILESPGGGAGAVKREARLLGAGRRRARDEPLELRLDALQALLHVRRREGSWRGH